MVTGKLTTRGPTGKMAVNVPCVAVRGSTGIGLSYGPPRYEEVSSFIKDDYKNCKAMSFSPDGKYFAWISGATVKIVSSSTWAVVGVIEKPKVCAIQFSTLGTYLMTWEPFIVSQTNPQGNPQLHIWKSENGEHVKSFTQKRQIDWEPQWSDDEKICALLINTDILIYENADFEKEVHRINVTKAGRFKIAPGSAPYHIVIYTPGKTGQPSFARLFEYPKLDSAQSLATKSFFQSDRVDFYWNAKGTSVLIMTSMDIDKTGASYYGKQALHYLSTKGDTAIVTLGEEGPIHALEWSPKSNEFAVIYGFMPSKGTLFNLKCDPVFEFGKKHRNSIYYNPQGNILLLGGFGNLRGGIELWDMTQRKLIAEADAADTTLLQWSPDGQHFMTATTAPRLRMANGFKIWHYTGTLLYERPWNKQEELWEVLWQRFPLEAFPEQAISYKAVEGIAPSAPQASKQVYRPPSARGRTINFKLHDDDDDDAAKKNTGNAPSKAALKARKKREAKKAKKELEANAAQKTNSNGQEILLPIPTPRFKPAIPDPDLTDDPEKNKKIKIIKSKLKNINKLKEQQAAGKQLEKNQIEKIKKEDDLQLELAELTL
ncbi:eukaryotic translation initiation factor 2A [Microplitis demolitor]|uniref:eukaryotic translation initiation factor 2A n=1 Tax=Microplitis demolitor TaxID=69319 RepID=UPI0004CC9F43|nr:eukaryotic translation initiation factor 2A [Microplitis demolitor]